MTRTLLIVCFCVLAARTFAGDPSPKAEATKSGDKPTAAMRDSLQHHYLEQLGLGEDLKNPGLQVRRSSMPGDFGVCDQGFRVSQILKDGRALVYRISDPGSGPADFTPSDPSNELSDGPYVLDHELVKGVADRAFIRMDGGIHITGTYDYVSANGSKRSILVIRGLAMPDAPTLPSEVCAGEREWSDKTGRFKKKAIYTKADRGKITLRNAVTNKTAEVPLSMLSRADQAYVRKMIETDKAWVEEQARKKTRRR